MLGCGFKMLFFYVTCTVLNLFRILLFIQLLDPYKFIIFNFLTIILNALLQFEVIEEFCWRCS